MNRDAIVLELGLLVDFETLGRNEFGRSEYRHRKTGIVFVPLPGATFTMGTSHAEVARWEQLRTAAGFETDRLSSFLGREQPAHTVTLRPYLIAKHEVTQEQWSTLMPSNPSSFRGERRPVENVSWDACQDFCQAAGLQLPTEAQWEFACRAGTETAFSWGDTIAVDQVRFNGRLFRESQPVGTPVAATGDVDALPPNDFGLHGMHGNVCEWCRDSWDSSVYSKAESTRSDPVCRNNSMVRSHRGGAWMMDSVGIRSAARGRHVRTKRTDYLGFRPVYEL